MRQVEYYTWSNIERMKLQFSFVYATDRWATVEENEGQQW